MKPEQLLLPCIANSSYRHTNYDRWRIYEHIIYEIIQATLSPHLCLRIYIFQNEEREQEVAERDTGSNRPFRMRFAPSSSFRIKLVQGCNILGSSVHVLKPAVFMAPLRLRLNHTPTALLTTIVGRV